ncbi:MFS transporter [Streptomyces sp. AV19]|uniref:MFS transporter n=1 Tax=Streptomyces sp. AV19 TaxID=2793068 RepID=UPI002413C749|nr:MFS transporter [Streptomyces sp. AV19]MDG4536178.1 MFS transporter [Streptomyces sp. AV19]
MDRAEEKSEPAAASRSEWAALWGLLLGAFMGFIDIFIVNVASPSIQDEMNASFADIQLVPAGYTLAYGAGLVTGGRLGDRFGRRRVFAVGTLAFGLTSAACAAAQSPGVLVGARVLQGLAAAVMLPQILALVQVVFRRPGERARAIGIYGAVIGSGVVAGQILGGLLIRWDVAGLGWRAVFLVNLPLCGVVLAGTGAVVREPGKRTPTRLDLGGVLLLAPGLFGLLRPVVVGGDRGWTAPLAVELSAAVLLLILFIVWELRVTRSGGVPLLPPRLFRQRGFSLGPPTALFFYGVNGAFVFLLAFYLQRAAGLSPLAASLEFVPMAVLTSIASMLCGRLEARFGRQVVPMGGILMAAGLLAVWAVLETVADPGGQALPLVPGLLVYGFGGGIVATSLIGRALAGVAPEDAGAASGGILTAVQASEALGVAGIGALFGALTETGGYVHGLRVCVIVLTGLSLATSGLLHFPVPRPSTGR